MGPSRSASEPALRLLRPLADQKAMPSPSSTSASCTIRPRRAGGPCRGGVVVSKGCRAGRCPAQHNLGIMYGTGQGVPQDHVAAVSWYRKAAEQGDRPAQLNLGFVYGQVRACRRTMPRRRRGIARLPTRAMPPPSTTSASCTITARACRRTMPRRCRGIARRPQQGHAARAASTSASCTITARACRRTMPRRRRGIESCRPRVMPPPKSTSASSTARSGRAAGPCSGGIVVSQSCRPGRCRRPVQPRHPVRHGQGVPLDYVQAHKWLRNLASLRYAASDEESREDAVRDREIVAAKMTPVQIAEAQKLARSGNPSPTVAGSEVARGRSRRVSRRSRHRSPFAADFDSRPRR